ncbi:TBC1 domain member 31, partial [Nowakowskiella sp. JEL0407]
MGVSVVNVSERKSGKISTNESNWSELLAFLASASSEDPTDPNNEDSNTKKGIILRIINTQVDAYTPSRSINFTCISFNSDRSTFFLALGDQKGNIYAVDITNNKFWTVARTGISSTCIEFSKLRKREALVGFSDNSIHCYNTENGQLIAKLPAVHTSHVETISFHPTKPLVITSSSHEAILWDTLTWTRKRVLMGAEETGVRQIAFTPNGQFVVTSFNDKLLYIWDQDFAKSKQLPIDTPIGQDTHNVNWFTISLENDCMAHISSKGLVVIRLSDYHELYEIVVPENGSMTDFVWIKQVQFLKGTE